MRRHHTCERRRRRVSITGHGARNNIALRRGWGRISLEGTAARVRRAQEQERGRGRDLARRVAATKVDFLAPHASLTRAGILAWAAEHELPVWVWTVNDEREGIARLTRVAKVAPPTASTVTTTHRDMIHGMTANAFLSVSLHPPLVLVSLGRCRMSEMLPRTGR